MQIHTIYPRGFASNTYAITTDNKTAIIVDPSQPRVQAEIEKRGLIPVCVLLTHCHFDHVGCVDLLQAQGAKVYTSAAEKPLTCTSADMAQAFGAPQTQYTVDETFADGETKTLCGIRITAIFTPGHTKGSVCYLLEHNGEKALITGDTLFAGSVGRCDLLTGNTGELMQSLKKLLALKEDLPIYSGHGEETTLFTEQRTNPFLQDL